MSIEAALFHLDDALVDVGHCQPFGSSKMNDPVSTFDSGAFQYLQVISRKASRILPIGNPVITTSPDQKRTAESRVSDYLIASKINLIYRVGGSTGIRIRYRDR